MKKSIESMTPHELEAELLEAASIVGESAGWAFRSMVKSREVYLQAAARNALPDPAYALYLLGKTGELEARMVAAIRVLEGQPDDVASLGVLALAGAYYEMAMRGPS